MMALLEWQKSRFHNVLSAQTKLGRDKRLNHGLQCTCESEGIVTV